jgi:hypothetical protein
MDLERGCKKRVEIEFNGQTGIQVYNGTRGWKLRPFLNGHQVETYTPEELKSASADADLDGLLIDYAAKGSKVELASVDQMQGRSAYNLTLSDKNGNTRHVWVDAETFLEIKVEGTPRRLDGKYHPVSTPLSIMQRIDDAFSPGDLGRGSKGQREDRDRNHSLESKIGRDKIRNAALSLSPPLGASRLFDLTGNSAPARSNVLDLS